MTVGAGSTLSLSNARIDLGCSDLVVSGTMNTDSASVAQAVDVNIASGGTLNGGSGTLDVTGNWTRTGTFNAGTGRVNFIDGCGTTSSTISGASTFNDLQLTTSTGKQVFFEAGQTTTVSGTVTLAGASGNLLEIRSTVDGSEAFLDLAQAATGVRVDVKDNHAIGAPVALLSGSVISGNADGWVLRVLLPGLTLLGLGVLGASLYVTGRRSLRAKATAHG